MNGFQVLAYAARQQQAFTAMCLNECGYQTQTTFWSDFSVADCFGIKAIKDTYHRCFKEWRTNITYLTEFVLVLNHKIWYWAKKGEAKARLYDQLWREADNWAHDNLTGEDAHYYFRTLD